MKKFYTILLALILTGVARSNATVMIVTVSDFQFAPANFTVNAGDTIMWVWNSGTHTTTSNNIPPGALPWDAPIDNSSPIYVYIPLVGGNYDYECDFHSQMQATFTVVGTVGIEQPVSSGNASLNTSMTGASQLNITYNLPSAGVVDLAIYDLIGNKVLTISKDAVSAGLHAARVNVEGLQKGVYLLNMQFGEGNITRKIMVQ